MATTTAAPTHRSTRTRHQVKVQAIYDDDANGEDETTSMTTAGSNDRKKIRTTAAPLLPPIYNVPESVMIHIADYVDGMSRLLLAAALTASPKEFIESDWKIKPCAAARIILNHDFENEESQEHSWVNNFIEKGPPGSCVDFWYSDEELASRLSDGDIGGVLTCLIHTFKVTHVKLTNCVSVSGRCLAALRGSKDLLQLDLSFTYYKNYGVFLHLDSVISEQCVIPILDDIITTEGCSLTHIQFPKKWREERSVLLAKFLFRFNRAASKRNVPCCDPYYDIKDVGCLEICGGTALHPWINFYGYMFGTFNFTCWSCTESYCSQCAETIIPDALCSMCERRCCNKCARTLKCSYCQETTCHTCTFINTCETCNKTLCEKCCPVSLCDYCQESRCGGCCDFDACEIPGCNRYSSCSECSDKDYNLAKGCLECNHSFCGEHLLQYYISDIITEDCYCEGCEYRAALKMLEENRLLGSKVMHLESTYATKGRDCWTSCGKDIVQGIKARVELLKRYHSVGMLLSPRQKQLENFDQQLKHFDQQLKLHYKIPENATLEEYEAED